MVWMTIYHLSFDLNQFGYIQQDFYHDPVWTGQRTLIVSLFLACAGMGQALAVAAGQSWARFWRRWVQVVACALLVTAGSWLMYPQSFIYFGVLHGMAVMLLVARLTVGWGRWLWPAGAGLIAIYFIAPSALSTVAGGRFVDIFEFTCAELVGHDHGEACHRRLCALVALDGRDVVGRAAGSWLGAGLRAGRFTGRLPVVFQPLVRLGRWSLSYYMLHQPVMIGALMLLGWLLTRLG